MLVVENYFEKVEDLVIGKIYVNFKILKCVLFFIVVCYFGYLVIVEKLIDLRIDVNKDDYLVILLVVVCYGGYLSVMNLLLKKGVCEINKFFVKYVGYIGVVLKLVRLGIDVKINDFLFIVVCVYGYLDLVDKKFNMEIDVNLIDGDKILLIVVCYFGYLNVVEGLINVGVDVDLGNGFIIFF